MPYPTPIVSASFASLCAAGLLTPSLSAQCNTGWQTQFSPGAGASHDVYASHLWDRDGAGPLPPMLVVGGRFVHVGGTAAAAVAMQDPSTGQWSALSDGMSNPTQGATSVRAFATMANGDLVAAGNFMVAGGVPAARIARWDGTAWAPLGSGLIGLAGTTSEVRALCVLPNGDLIAGGDFVIAGGGAATKVARWDGVAWSPMGLGFGTNLNETVHALAALPNGDVVAGGSFLTSGPVTANHIARWNGTAWSSLGGPLPTVSSLLVLPNGDLLAGGEGTGSVPSQYLLNRWNGTAWSAAGSFDSAITALGLLPNGDLVVGGRFTRELTGPTGSPHLARWNGVAWSGVGTGLAGAPQFGVAVATLGATASGELLVGGAFATAGGLATPNLARWDGSAWQPVGLPGFDASVMAVARAPNGDLLVGGEFTTAAGWVPARGVARWNGAAWAALGAGPQPNGAMQPVRAVTALANGDVIAGGSFTVAGGAVADYVARWDGSAWQAMAPGLDGTVHALVTMPNGDVFAGGDFTSPGSHVARWDGIAWSPLGAGTTLPVYCLATMPNGDLVAGGAFMAAGGSTATKIARWNGSAWAPISNVFDGFATIYCLHVAANGDLVVGGALGFTSPAAAIGVARWNGTAWSAYGSGLVGGAVRAVTTLPNGDLLAGGAFNNAGGVLAPRIARWNGASWSAAGAMDGEVLALACDASGVPVAGGAFVSPAPKVASTHLARLTTNCPALAATFAPGCPSSGGANSLTATALPWLGGTFVATAQGLPTNAVTISATSTVPVAPGFPLSTLWPQAGPGCDLHVALDLVSLVVTGNGTVRLELPLPNVPAFAGVTLRQQLMVFDVLGPITTTNALLLTAGSL